MRQNICFISAGAGSGKTYRLTEVLKEALVAGRARPGGVIGTTFTKKAAAELRERVRRHLFESGNTAEAVQIEQALLGTVNSVCGRLLQRFAFEIGLSPDLEVIPEEDGQRLFNQVLEGAASLKTVREMNAVSHRMGISDWKEMVKKIVDAARANNMATDAVRSFGKENADQFLFYFPDPSTQDLDHRLSSAIDRALSGIEGIEDSTKGTAKYLELLKGARFDLKENRLCWSQWVKLSKELPTKRSLKFGEAVQSAALSYDAHPTLHADIRRCCEIVFTVAAESLAAYQGFKRKRCLIDFVDQEQFLLSALDLPVVVDVLSQELDLLLVDEFQDTSPIQLALFLKLSAAAKEAVFVGDIKQAIYGFRGSDPELMQTVLRSVQEKGGKTEVLDSSWRSRPALVTYINEIFAQAFSNTIPAAQVVLIPKRKETCDLGKDPVVEHWIIKGKNASERAKALSCKIKSMVEAGRRITDRNTKEARPVRFSDIAVFARTHSQIETIASELSGAGIPVNIQRGGLLNTPEACLAMACLKRLSDQRDTLAGAEVAALSTLCDSELWLSDRLEHLEAGKDGYRWGEDENTKFPLLRTLAGVRHRLDFLTPSEAVDYVIHVADLHRIVLSWGPNTWRGQRRLTNLEGLVALAGKYEEHSRAQRRAGTIGGLLLWLYELRESRLDLMPEDLTGDAVNILTHHGAKGLEWPVVISTELNGSIWSRLWDLNAVSDAGTIDLNDPLVGRRLCFWPWPFGAQKTGIQVAERIGRSEWGEERAKQDMEEAKRLLYVSLTRTRDLLILPFPEGKTRGPWIDSLCADWMVPTGICVMPPGGAEEISAAVCECEGEETKKASLETYRPFWFGERAARTDKLPAVVNPSGLAGSDRAGVLSVEKIGAGIEVKGVPDFECLGNVVHAVIAAELVNPGHKDMPILPERLIQAHGLIAHVNPSEVYLSARLFLESICKMFTPQQIYAEYPISHLLKNGQLVKGWIDVLIQTKSGWIIIDHKSLRPKEGNEAAVQKFAGQLAAYRDAVVHCTGEKVQSCWIHLPLRGCLVQI